MWQGWSNGGKNQNPKKSHAEFPIHQNFQRNYTARICGNYHKSLDLFWIPKSLYLNQATQKILAKIFLPKKILKSKISNPKKSLDHPGHLKSRVPPWAPVDIVYNPQTLDESVCIICFFNYRKMCCFNSLLIACQTHLFVIGLCSLSFHSLLDCNPSRV